MNEQDEQKQDETKPVDQADGAGTQDAADVVEEKTGYAEEAKTE